MKLTQGKLFALIPTIAIIALFLISVKNAILYSQDFQWSGAKTLLSGMNPYEVYLSSLKSSFFIKSQAPNYLHFLYYLLMPYAVLSESTANLSWALTNVTLLILSCALIAKTFRLPLYRYTLIMLLLMLTGFPARNAIGNGQVSILALACILGGMEIMKGKPLGRFISPLIYGISYAKYSFLPAFFTFALVTYGPLYSILSTVPSLLGLIAMMATLFNLALIIQPLQVSSMTMVSSYGIGDLLSLINIGTHNTYPQMFKALGLVCVAISCWIVWISKNANISRSFSIATVSSLMFVSHLGYDYVFYAILLGFAFSRKSRMIERYAIFSAWAWIGYGYRACIMLSIGQTTLMVITFVFNTWVLWALMKAMASELPVLGKAQSQL